MKEYTVIKPTVINNICKGCLSMYTGCSYIKGAKEFKCPCITCLIKVVCEEGCEKFENFISQCLEGVESIQKGDDFIFKRIS